MECKVFFTFLLLSQMFSIDLTRMECKGIDISSIFSSITCIDLTRMECKDYLKTLKRANKKV